MDSPSFSNITDECEYWKLRSQKYLEELAEVKKEYDEFVEQSHAIETEMDATLEQKVKKINELTTNSEREKEALMVKLNTKNTEISTMAKQLTSLNREFESMKVDVRILEQTNDNLEQAQRIAVESKEIVENLLFDQYEKIALLEEEVEEKQGLEEELQRLRDEVRDLREELKRRRSPLELMPVKRIAVASQAGGDCLQVINPVEEEEEVVTMGSSLHLLIRTTVRDMVRKLDNLQAKLRAHREKRPLPELEKYTS